MGRKKKFIDKKHSATFQLIARDTADTTGGTHPSDRVFVRVDNNAYSLPSPDPSIFADAPSDAPPAPPATSLPDHVRREILELGLPDDGYNYLLHLREITNAGGGASYFQNDRARMDLVPVDVKAYDASRLRIGDADVDGRDEKIEMYAVASGTMGVRVGRALDADVAKLLEDDGRSMASWDLDEDFVAIANRQESGDGDVDGPVGVEGWLEEAAEVSAGIYDDAWEPEEEVDPIGGEGGAENQRMRRLLDAEFDLLALREYDSESDSEDAEYARNGNASLAAKVNDALKGYSVNDLELEDQYRVPADYVHGQGKDNSKLVNSSAEVLQKCAEYAEMYSYSDKEKEEAVIFQESSDESEVWDCETIVTTYTNLDNHPGKISAPEKPSKKLPELSTTKGNVISLRGKEKIPMDFLPNNKKISTEKVKKLGAEQPNRRPQNESKEAKKERKAAVKEEKREARRSKKDLKELYKFEAQKAQKVAAFAGPSSIHLM